LEFVACHDKWPHHQVCATLFGHAFPEALFYKASGDWYESISVANPLIFLTFGAKLD
jgi:hypothetical protein